MIGAPVFLREILAHSRRPRTYAFQAVFLAILVVCVIPLWPTVGKSGSEIADTARQIFEYGGYLQLILLALLAPAVTANAITEEKSSNTLDLLLLTGTGPFAIVLGKFISRFYVLAFLLFLTLPLLFALLTLGGISGSTILIEFFILISFAALAASTGIFLSTILQRTTSALVGGYVILGFLLASPVILVNSGLIPTTAFTGRDSLLMAYMSPLYDMHYVFNPSRYVATESVPASWWITPAWNVGLGFLLVMSAGWLLPYARSIESTLSLRKILEGIDRLTYLALRPSLIFKGVRPNQVKLPDREPVPNRQAKAVPLPAEGAPGAPARAVGRANPVYWKETTVNTIGRFRYWWRMNLVVLVLLGLSYWVFQDQLADIQFQKAAVATLAGVLVLLATIIAATTVSKEREDGTLVLLATTPLSCATYVEGKARGIARNIVFLMALPFLHVTIFVVAGVISPWTLMFLVLSIPIATAASIMQGIFVSLMFPTTLRAIVWAIVVVILEAVLPLVCCLPQFNLPMACWFMVEGTTPVAGAASGSGSSFIMAMLLACVFGGSTQLGYTFVVYSLIRSGFDRYIGRAA